MKKQVLVTGGTGYIGSHTVVELINVGFEVIIIDNLSNSKIEVLDGIQKITGIRPLFEKIDLCNKKSLNSFFKNPKSVLSGIYYNSLENEMMDKVIKKYNMKL